MSFCEYVTSKSSWKNEVEIKLVYMISSEFGLRSEKSMLDIRGFGISSWNH